MALQFLHNSVASAAASQLHGGALEREIQVVRSISSMGCYPSTSGRMQMDFRDRQRCWEMLGKSLKFRHIKVPSQAGSMLRGFQASAAAAERGTSSERIVAGDESGLKSYVWSDGKRPRICVLGGGFGGLYTALRLESLVWPPDRKPQVVLIDQSERFVFKPLLYELLSKEVDPWEIAPTFKELLSSTSIQFCQDTVKSVQPAEAVNGKPALATTSRDVGGTVYLDSGTQVDYDWLVLALGSEPRLGIVPGASEFALPFATLEDALEVDRRLLELERDRYRVGTAPIEVVVVGSGYCGVELAATLAERLGNRGNVKVVDTTSDIVASAPAGNREAALKVLSARNVDLVLGYSVANMTSVVESSSEETPPSSLNSKRVCLELKPPSRGGPSRRATGSSRVLEADLALWTVGNKTSLPPAETQGGYQAFPVNGRGQADTDEMLRVKGHPRIFAIGDSAGTKDGSGRQLPSTAQVAFQQADYAGWNLWAAINNRPLLPFRYQHLGEMMTLGTNDGAVSVSFIEGITLDGFLGHTVDLTFEPVKELMKPAFLACWEEISAARKLAYLYRLPTNEHKAKVGLSWLAKSTVSSLAFLQDSITRVLSTSS